MDLKQKARSLPQSPGCYLMKDKRGDVIYVGKALNLKNRVMCYFNNSEKTPKTQILVSHIKDFDFILAASESEAFILENNLIKKHGPKYNIQMRDDKTYPYVLIDYEEPFPKLKYVRRFKRKKNQEVFGPFVFGSNISEVIRVLTKTFRLRDCSLREFKSRKVPCVLYQMYQCSAPCVGEISEEKYLQDLKKSISFLKGKGNKVLKDLDQLMYGLADKEQFEKAAQLRDYIDVLRSFNESEIQKNADLKKDTESFDIISTYEGEVEIDLAIYMVRKGILLGSKNFHFPVSDLSFSLEEELSSFILQYYTNTEDDIPKVIMSTLSSKTRKSIEETLEYYFYKTPEGQKRIKLQTNVLESIRIKPVAKRYESLYELVQENASEQQRVRLNNKDSEFIGLNKLQDLLNLKERPVILECYDVAVFSGKSPTASQIVFVNGKPKKESYRYYHLKELPEGNNDYAMLREVLKRRIKHGKLPDVFVVDGGKGQVGTFCAVLEDAGIEIPVVGIAKSKTKKGLKTEERLIIPKRVNPYVLKKNRSLLKIITSMRDEAHRFSRKLHHKKEKSRLLSSWLDEIKGVGPATKQKILNLFKNPREEIADMGVEELKSKLKISESLAKKIKQHTIN
ncbi:MAG: excinuclease ABC subunit UvrC [Bacteriovoracaceae bacterium]